MSKILSAVLIFALLLTLGSCDGAKESRADLFDGAFMSEFHYVDGDLSIRARLEAEANKSDGAKRDIRLTFLEPDSLLGICVERHSEIYEMSYSGVRISSEAAAALAEMVELFECDGEVISSEIVSYEGQRAELLRIKRFDGSELSLYSDTENCMPICIVGSVGEREVNLHIITFEKFGERK